MMPTRSWPTRIAAIQLVTNPEKLDAISARRTLRL